MYRYFTAIMMAAAMLVCLPLAYAQFREGPPYDVRSVTALVDRVHTDLDQAYRSWHFSSGDRDRLNQAEKELREFVRRWDDHKFDKDKLDDAISSIQHVLDNNKLPSRDRDAMSDDVTQLRRMREAYDRHEIGDFR